MPSDERRRPRPWLRVHPVAAACWLTFLAVLVWLSVAFPDDVAVRRGLAALGPLAPLAYVLGEIGQIILIPIPGQPFEIAGGWLFGLWTGALLGTAGALAGSMAAFGLGRRYGRAWVERHVGADVRERFARRFGRGARADWVVFSLMLVPSFPRDPLCYLAGISGLSARRFALIAVIGRPVGLAPWVALGAEGVALGIEVQLLMIAVAVVLWGGHMLWHGLRRDAPIGLGTAGTGERHA